MDEPPCKRIKTATVQSNTGRLVECHVGTKSGSVNFAQCGTVTPTTSQHVKTVTVESTASPLVKRAVGTKTGPATLAQSGILPAVTPCADPVQDFKSVQN